MFRSVVLYSKASLVCILLPVPCEGSYFLFWKKPDDDYILLTVSASQQAHSVPPPTHPPQENGDMVSIDAIATHPARSTRLCASYSAWEEDG